jgi:hypothetical protein
VHVEPGLTVTFAVDGPMQVPAQGTARFADGLWQHTCFEVFVSRPGMPGYQEFNLSPSGEWAAYGFSGYRSGMTRLEARPHMSAEQNRYRVQIDLQGPMLLGICAVMEEEGGRLSYWALKHPPGRPDFHHADAFALALP